MSQEKQTNSEHSASNLNKFQTFFYNYGRFHYNLSNIIIHILCVPIIVVTLDRMIGLLAKQIGLTFNPFLF